MNSVYKIKIPLAFIIMLAVGSPAEAGHPACHIMICCRENNAGSTFLVNGQWNPNHQYNDIETVRDILQKIKDAGIQTVFVDMTNASQWGEFWEQEQISLNNIHQVCQEKGMQWAMHIGNAAADQGFWIGVANTVWDTWAQTPTYRKYGYGDDRPILIMFQTYSYYTSQYNNLSAQDKAAFDRFHIGTTVGNGPEPFNQLDGWGYRQTFQNTSGSVRFGAPVNGFDPNHPTDFWVRISETEWRDRVQWIKDASEYSIYGSYDDMCDAISFGIANTDNTTTSWNVYHNRDPYVYYNAVKDALTTPVTVTRQPYGGGPSSIPGTIQAEAYDLGGEGVAYHDADAGNNKGNIFRSDGVDIESSTPNGFNVASIASSEWLEYTVNVQQAGAYVASIRVASLDSLTSLSMSFNGQDKTGTLTRAATGGWQTWETVSHNLSLEAGTQVMRINLSGSGFNLDAITFSLMPGITPPPQDVDAGSDAGTGTPPETDVHNDSGAQEPETVVHNDSGVGVQPVGGSGVDPSIDNPNGAKDSSSNGCGCRAVPAQSNPLGLLAGALYALLMLYRFGRKRPAFETTHRR